MTILPTDKLPLAVTAEIETTDNEMGEVAIKRGLGRSDFTVDPRLLRRGLLDNGYRELPVRDTMPLPWIGSTHPQGPFDRMLIAQSILERHIADGRRPGGAVSRSCAPSLTASAAYHSFGIKLRYDVMFSDFSAKTRFS